MPLPVALLDKCKNAKANYNAALEKERKETEKRRKKNVKQLNSVLLISKAMI